MMFTFAIFDSEDFFHGVLHFCLVGVYSNFECVFSLPAASSILFSEMTGFKITS